MLSPLLVLCTAYTFAQLSLESNDLTEILCSVNFPTRQDVCPTIYAPVCASYPRECLILPCPQVQDFPSNCDACQNINVQSYRPGVCVFTCDANVAASAVFQGFSPVCAINQEGCNNSSCRQSFRNWQEACLSTGIISYTNGVCEGDVLEDEEAANEEGFFGEEVNPESFEDEETVLIEEDDGSSATAFYASILCDDPRPEICNDISEPVCIIECADATCRRTASNACNACSDPNVLVYTPQSCEEERVQCPVLDLGSTEVFCVDLWDPVCAYSSDCTSGSCGVTSSNDCNACSVQGADYYIRGECPGYVPPSE